MAEKKGSSLTWCYFGENKDQVMMICSKEDWESIIRIVNWANTKLHEDMLHESDEWNYGYTRENRRP